jgi:hypothetical protein
MKKKNTEIDIEVTGLPSDTVASITGNQPLRKKLITLLQVLFSMPPAKHRFFCLRLSRKNQDIVWILENIHTTS